MTTEIYRQICLYLRKLIAATEWEGQVYSVGGCCRDSIMGLPIKDVDLAVTQPDGGIAFADWLHDRGLTADKPVTFPKFGTARIRLAQFPDEELELVQTRREKYSDRTSRDPSIVFGTIEEDCFRRDLTINSLYYDISNDRVLDITGRGIADIEAQIIRTPCDPNVTFDDDPVRIIRAVRFAAKFGWKIEPDAYRAMKANIQRLEIITPERMQGEFEKVLLTPRPKQALNMLRDIGAIPYIMPELVRTFDMTQSKIHSGTVWEHILETIEHVAADPILRLSALLHDIGKIECRTIGKDNQPHFPGHDRRGSAIIDRVMRRLHYRSYIIDKVIFLCRHHEAAKRWGAQAQKMSDADLRRLQFICHSHRRLHNLLQLIDADNRSYAPEYCMPGQTSVIERRSEQMQQEGTAMFGYAFPVKASRIRKQLHIGGSGSEQIINRVKDEILNAAFHNPKLSREMALRIAEQTAGVTAAGEGEKSKKKARRRNNRQRK